jgi:hypothetical protein
VNALANPQVGQYLNEYFVSSFQRVGTFRIVGKQKQGGNVAAYFCAQDGRVLHAVAGPVDAATILREAKWVVETAKAALKTANGDGGAVKVHFRKAHAEKLRAEHGLVVEPLLFDPPDEDDANSTLTYRDPTGRPLAPKLTPPPVDGPDVKFAKGGAGGKGMAAKDGLRKVLSNQAKVHQLMASYCMLPIEKLYGAVFEGILGERISTRPVEVVDPFPSRLRMGKGAGGEGK